MFHQSFLTYVGLVTYAAGLIFFYSSRASVYFVDYIVTRYMTRQCPWLLAVIGCAGAILLWPVTQLMYAIHIELEDRFGKED